MKEKLMSLSKQYGGRSSRVDRWLWTTKLLKGPGSFCTISLSFSIIIKVTVEAKGYNSDQLQTLMVPILGNDRIKLQLYLYAMIYYLYIIRPVILITQQISCWSFSLLKDRVTLNQSLFPLEGFNFKFVKVSKNTLAELCPGQYSLFRICHCL